MELTPAASVVIPCYNQGRFVGDAIDSALRQSVSTEVIVVDDGSTDDTSAVVARRPAARVVRQRNQGTAAARNAGLRESRAAFVVFLDADDRLLPHAAALGIGSLAAHPEWAFVTGHVRLIDSDGSIGVELAQTHRDGGTYVGLLRSNYIWTPGVVMYRRAVLEAVGGFQHWARGSADYELNIRIARRFPFGCHHQVILEYRQHDANMSADASLMLRSAISVRRSERPHLGNDPGAHAAWQEGIAIVRADFGERLVEQVKNDLRSGRGGRAWRGVFTLARYYPAGVRTVLTRAARRLIGA
jgi:glycosyltransferase involved in cell wall biosynthesis